MEKISGFHFQMKLLFGNIGNINVCSAAACWNEFHHNSADDNPFLKASYGC